MAIAHLIYDDSTEFKKWLGEVDQLCLTTFQLTLSDLSDLNTRDAFDAGTTPAAFFEDDVMTLMREEYGALIDQL